MIKFISCRNLYLLSGGSLLLVAALVTAVLAFRVFWVCFSLNHELFNSSIPKNNPIIPSKQALEIYMYEWSENCFIIIRPLKLYICIYLFQTKIRILYLFSYSWFDNFFKNSFFKIYFFIFTCYDFFYRYHDFEILILVFCIRLEFEINLCIIITT